MRLVVAQQGPVLSPDNEAPRKWAQGVVCQLAGNADAFFEKGPECRSIFKEVNMPGLVALLTPQYDMLVAQNIAKMTESMRHEAFYKTEIFEKDGLPFVASRVHLNIVNKEPQPIYNEDRTALIMMDGELHSRDAIREKLISAGHTIRTKDDAELLLHLYEEAGEDFANNLNGWFLAIIYDSQRRKTLIVNDCFGLSRAYYVRDNNTFVVASEIKCLLEYAGLSYTVNKESVAEYFFRGGTSDGRTMFNEIHRLPPASLWIYKDGVISKKQYFDISKVGAEPKVNEEEFFEEAARIFTSVLPRYLAGNEVGLSLTGGWDTRAIFATMSHLNYKVPCYTWCGPYRDSLDIKLARKLAKAWGQQLTVFCISTDFFDDFANYARKIVHITDGLADIFASHEVYLNSLVRTLAPIRLTGKYGSEIASQLFIPCRRPIDLRILSGEFLAMRPAGLSFENLESIIKGLHWMWPAGFLAVEGSQLVVRTPYSDRDLVEFLLKAPQGILQGHRVQKFIADRNDPSSVLIPSDKGEYVKTGDVFLNAKLSSISFLFRLLATLDRAYLHPDVPHICTRLDPLMRWTRLERTFLGYSNLVSYRIWIKNELRDFVRGILSDERTLSRSYLDPAFVKQMTADHFGNRANYTREIGKIVSLEIWHRLFVDKR
jgi:asparagine synthase (glutamine-hydrolysing)